MRNLERPVRMGGHSMVAPLRRVLVKRPGESFGAADPALWHYAAAPDLAAARREHDGLMALLRRAGVQIVYQQPEAGESADSIYTHDPSIVTDAGAILLNMGKRLRRDEPRAAGRALRRLGVPILGELHEPARAEGGDLLWIDPRTLAVGQGFRTNEAGLRRLELLLEPLGVTLLPVPLPDHRGPDACLHLMSLVSLVDRDLALVYPPLLPPPFVELLHRRGYRTVEVPETEFESMGPNVLAVGPRECVMLEGNVETRSRLERAGCTVATYRGSEISLKAEGGATCLTRPIFRECP